MEKYIPRIEEMDFEDEDRKEEALEYLKSYVDEKSPDYSPDFINFFKAVMKLNLHMFLNDPPISVAAMSIKERKQKEGILEKFDFWMYSKNDYYCIDGFPKEGNPCAIVLPPPYRSGYVYQGIKPAVIVIDTATTEIKECVRAKQERLLENLK